MSQMSLVVMVVMVVTAGVSGAATDVDSPNYGRFQRGTGTYKCVDCGRKTRDTGNGEVDDQLCRACYEMNQLEIQSSDWPDQWPDEKVQQCMDAIQTQNWTQLKEVRGW